MPMEYRYPGEDQHDEMDKKVKELKKMIEEKVPNTGLDQYDLLDHQSGRCDYDPYDRYDAEWEDEGGNFGHMFSEAVPSTYQDGDGKLEAPEEEPEESYDTNLQESYDAEDQIYENPEDMPEEMPEEDLPQDEEQPDLQYGDDDNL